MANFSLKIHGIPEETLRGYLTRLGGESRVDGQIAGPGWTARITVQPDYRLGSASFCCFLVEMEGEGAGEAWRQFRLRVLRPGG